LADQKILSFQEAIVTSYSNEISSLQKKMEEREGRRRGGREKDK